MSAPAEWPPEAVEAVARAIATEVARRNDVVLGTDFASDAAPDEWHFGLSDAALSALAAHLAAALAEARRAAWEEGRWAGPRHRHAMREAEAACAKRRCVIHPDRLEECADCPVRAVKKPRNPYAEPEPGRSRPDACSNPRLTTEMNP